MVCNQPICGNFQLTFVRIDNSPEALQRQAALRKRDRLDKGDEEWERRQIQEQVERAHLDVKADRETPIAPGTLQRTDGKKFRLEFDSKPPAQPHIGGPGALVKDSDLSTAEDSLLPTVKKSLTTVAPNSKNVFKAKNRLTGKKAVINEPPKKVTEQERIMKQEKEAMERKRERGKSDFGNGGAKRQKYF
jgi:DNA/RNA-binding protein KIN17